ncbi:alpha/beta-hydrolase [Pleomassaria siparia CBS 279.74]|uniref:Alpha/beta-hydrolase n=1 Tax=Pleomassaria siparia CBS 279.74 TaxID=1314801 RepID=A0A6G1KP24_9PLEO|nr:alpha/beta-hydrolase [Pleomassaria siparia CBS 279.74]
MSKLTDYKLLSFDVYGTLIDWERGAVAALQPVLQKAGKSDLDGKYILEKYHQVDTANQKKSPSTKYSDLLTANHPELCEKLGLDKPTPEESKAFGASVGSWPAFPDSVEALKRLSKYFKLVVLSNVDNKSFAASNSGPLEGFKFDAVFTAEDIGSYKPDLRNFEYMFNEVKERFGIEKSHVLQTAQSQFHDHHPIKELGFKSSWIYRPGAIMGNRDDPVYNWKFDTLADMADAVEKELGSPRLGLHTTPTNLGEDFVNRTRIYPLHREGISWAPAYSTKVKLISRSAPAYPLDYSVHPERPAMRHTPLRWGGSPSNLQGRTIIIVMFSSTALLLFYTYAGGQLSFGRNIPYSTGPTGPPIVTLPDYASFQGTQILATLKTKIAFAAPIDAFLGVNYSTQPIGPGRFAPVTWPEPVEGVVDASDYGPQCIQPQPGGDPQSEACLNFNLYRTGNITYDQKLPVLVFTHGGSFVSGSGKSFDGATFVSKSSEPILVVTFQYRLSALGSLPSALFEEEGLLNLGLRDQRQLLEFMQKYVSYFGGDPDQITFGGQSAGAHSVGIHLFHKYNSPDFPVDNLFARAILSSGSVTARSFPAATFPISARQFSDFMSQVNCPESPNTEALVCLRSVDVTTIQSAQNSVFNSAGLNWPFQPVSPGPLLEKRGSESGFNGTFFDIPILTTSCTNEGAGFVPQNLATNGDFVSFFTSLLPGLNDDDIADLQTLYPDPVTSGGPYTPDPDYPISPQYQRVSAAYADYSYICPVQETSVLLTAASAPVYKGRFNTPNYAPAGQGVPHASDAAYFNGLTSAQYPDISKLYSSYYASFVVSGDPNKFAIEGKVEWPIYGGVGSKELAVGSPDRGGVVQEDEGAGIRLEQCAWWRDPERMVRLNK